MGKYVNSKVYISNNDLQKQITLYEYVTNNLDDELKKEVKPVMTKARTIARSAIREGTWKNPKNRYSWKLKIKGTNTYKRKKGRYSRSLTVRDHSEPMLVFYEVTGAKKEYRLTHLIEHSHRIRFKGKIIPGLKTKSTNHMYVSQEHVDKEAPLACKKVIDKLFK